MKLLRATCECGFRSRKARVGYDFHQWWFPLLDTTSGQLTDVSRSLPKDQVNLIQRNKARAEELHRPFLQRVTQELILQYADQSRTAFNPDFGSTFECPGCRRGTLRIEPVKVTAICRADCGQEFPWHDSQQKGCPKCGHRPHRFRVDTDAEFAGQSRTQASCPCSASTDCASHLDAYCPRCGQLPHRYRTEGHSFCGIHHERLRPYRIPENFLFIETASRWVEDRFPNAKLWGDAESDDAVASSYCLSCELDHQRWLATEDVG